MDQQNDTAPRMAPKKTHRTDQVHEAIRDLAREVAVYNEELRRGGVADDDIHYLLDWLQTARAEEHELISLPDND